MNFTRYQLFFNFFSIALIGIFFWITFSKFGGFATSLSFNGGVRISIDLPNEWDKKKIDIAMKKIGLEDVLVRKTDIRSNIYDFEIGPKTRDAITRELSIKDGKTSKEINLKDNKKSNDANSIPVTSQERDNYRVTSAIADKLLYEAFSLTKESIISSETIAASYGSNLFSISLRIVIYTLVSLLIYLTFRFNIAFAFGACIALVHDLFLSIAFVGVAQIEPSIPVIAAILTLLGYSTNDTIVVFDRIRLNMEDRGNMISNSIIDLSITQTLSRTVVTALLTLLSVLAMLLGGEKSLKDFGLVLTFGIVMGTYSSIFIASPCILYYEKIKNFKWR